MSTRTWFLSSSCAAALLLTADAGMAQQVITQQVTLPSGMTLPLGSVVLNPGSRGPLIVRPPTGAAQPGHAHNNILIAIPPGGPATAPNTAIGPPLAGSLFETPASLACIYQLGVGGQNVGCNPYLVTANPSGGSKAIAIVDPFDYPVAAADLHVYNSQFGLAAANFTVIYGTGAPSSGCQNGPQPPADNGMYWNLDAALGIEIAHGMAPNARLYLVEANSSSNADLFNAVDVATACVAAAGGGQVSMRWGQAEFSNEATFDGHFNTGSNGVVYLASAGIEPGTQYPCVSPYVVCVGGTTISRSATGAFLGESAWGFDYIGYGTGGGPSAYEPRPTYQNFMSAIVGSARGVPDLAAVSDPVTGIWVYNSNEIGGWLAGPGATPLLAGILNFASFFYSSSSAMVSNIYQIGQSGTLAPFVTSIKSGTCGQILQFSSGYPDSAGPNWDPANIFATTGIPWSFCDGWGTPKDAGNPNWMRATR
jgi:kumamolisin